VHEPSVLSPLPEINGVEISCIVDWYDGPVDGIARYADRDWWFCAVADQWSVSSSPRILVLHDVDDGSIAAVKAEAERFEYFARAGAGVSLAVGRLGRHR
jgi:hypothetical protein